MPNINFDKLRRLLGLLPELTNFTPNAYRLWEALPPHTKTKILSNVWCGHCKKMTTIVNYSGRVIQGDILLEGNCQKCGGKVARIIEKKKINREQQANSIKGMHILSIESVNLN